MEKPILFNTEMVKAILEGRKTSTRRIIKNVEKMKYDRKLNNGNMLFKDTHIFTTKFEIKAPYKVGDILYVRETWCDVKKDFNPDNDIDTEDCKYIFKVDDNGEKHPLIESQVKRWRPSIHMPKVAARIFLKITDIKVEQIKAITAGECKKEGVNLEYPITDMFSADEYIAEFKELWNRTISKDWDKYGWEANPWVWAIEFERCENGGINH